jgi:3D (Asp-Asp-Asp) domain-containing protein
MRTLIARASLLAGCVVLTYGCASHPLPKFEQPLARAAIMNVRTTAYTHTESDHLEYTNHNALGGTLQSGPIHSAAADWSRWPAGSVFRIRETGEIYQVDDYGWALAGTNTIDLYKPSREAMNAWGVRRITIENLRWGDPQASLKLLRQRSGYAHIRRMVAELEDRMPEWKDQGYSPQQGSLTASNLPAAPAASATAAMAAPASMVPSTPIRVQPLPPVARAPLAGSGSGSTGGFQPPTRAYDSSAAAPSSRSGGYTGSSSSASSGSNPTTREAFLNSYH